MVWKLRATSSPDAAIYCFTAPGTYKIGRKDCNICITTDKTVSRVHAEFVIRPLPKWDPHVSSRNTKCEAVLRDLSKFGTFVNKSINTTPVNKLANREIMVRDGDEITFGTSNSTFSATYEHFFFCVSSLENESIILKSISVLGAYCVRTWEPECTHVLAEDGLMVSEPVLLAVSHRKPVVSLKWFEVLTSQSSPLVGELPKVTSYLPTLTFQVDNEDTTISVVEPHTRELVFKGMVFLACSLRKYFYEEILEMVVNAGGASLQLISSNSRFQDSRTRAIIVPHGDEVQAEFSKFQNIQRIKEKSLVLAVLSGCKDNCAFFSPPSVADSEVSSDATVDLQADSDDEAESVPDTPDRSVETVAEEKQIPVLKEEISTEDIKAKKPEPTVNDGYCSTPVKSTVKKDGEEFGEVKFVDLVVFPPTASGSNFKSFRRRVGAVSGNSYRALIPFASEPYRESSYLEEIGESIEREKKRNEQDRLADELFATEDLKRRKTNKGESLVISKRKK